MARDISEWLEELGLSKYSGIFAENEIDLEVIPELTEADLRELQLPMGPRKKLLKAIAALTPGLSVDLDRDEPLARSQSAATITVEAEQFSDDAEPQAVSAPAYAEAERRQLTVMFCDLVGSTELSTRLDPEDLQEVIRAYQEACAKVVARYNGYVAKYMGDGVLVYFGYPQAHENDAERAARAGLGIVEAMADIGSAHALLGEVDLTVRVGINTGLVVVGDIVGEGASEEASVVGETPNVAARLQALSEPNQVVIGPLTHELIGEAFAYESLGPRRLKGIAEPVHAWRVLREGDLDGDDEAAPLEGGLPLVGRQEELGLLLRSWEASKKGHGQAVLIQGEAGIGKSRLVEALREQVSREDYIWVAHRCSPYHANSTLYPAIEHLKRVMGWKPEDGAEAKIEKLEAALKGQSLPLEEAVPLYAELMSLPLPVGRYAPLELSAKQKREQTLDALVGWLLEMAERTPVLNVWEDLHWADPTTLELLALYIEQSPTVSMMNLLTYRPEFAPPWTMRSHMTPITLNRLERPEVEALIGYQANGKAVPSEVVEHIVGKADGVPLYVEELTKTILESDYIREEAARYTLSGSLSEIAIPATLQDTLMARLDRLPRVRELAQLGAVLGREFAYEMLQALAEVEEPSLLDGLDQLVDAELLYRRGRAPRAKYIFKHALIQDAAYESLLKRTRQRHHQQVAALMEERFPETVGAQPELVAHHYTEAGNSERAVHYWRRAGERARTQGANLEAIAYLTKGIELVHELPDSEERTHQEVSLQLSLGHATIVAKGHGAAGAEAAYTRALALCERLGDVPERVPTLYGLWKSYVVTRPLGEINDVAMQLRRIAEEKQVTEIHVIAHYALGYAALCMGNLSGARSNFEEGIAQYLPSQRSAETYRAAQDPGVACRGYLAMTDWLLGFPERALSRSRESVELAEELGDRFSLAYAFCFPGAIVSETCGGDTNTIVERGLEVATAGGFSLWIAFGKVQRARLRYRDQASESVLDELRQSVVAIPQMGVHTITSYYTSLFARACQEAGRAEEGLKALDDAQAGIEARGECWWEAEIQRLRGDILLSQSAENAGDAETCFEQALNISRKQEAKSLELRAAMSLARLRQQQGKGNDARESLRDCYAWFTEGFDTADLCEAKALLNELA